MEKKINPILSESPTLSDVQKYVAGVVIDRGFDKESLVETCLLLGEEVGELFKSVRKSSTIKTDDKSEISMVSEELADILMYISIIANKLNIDLNTAFIEKEKINKKRSWK